MIGTEEICTSETLMEKVAPLHSEKFKFMKFYTESNSSSAAWLSSSNEKLVI